MWTRVLIAGIVAMGVVSPASTADGDLNTSTIAAFDRYVQLTESRMARELAGQSPFLWVNRLPERERAAALSQLNQGQILSERLRTQSAGRDIDAPGGMIHHWIGTVLLPGSLARARAFVQDYRRYPEIFAPMVARAKPLSESRDSFVVAMRTTVERVVTVVIDADYHIDYRPLGPSKLYTKSVAMNIFEVRSPGAPGETRVPVERSSGYLWRLNTYCSFEETRAGTFEQCESISLTRGIPFGLGWLVGPFVKSIPKDTLEFTLSRVRANVGIGW